MTDNEIIKALVENIAFSIRCDSVYSTINITLLKETADLINRQKAEIERLHPCYIYKYAIKQFAERLKEKKMKSTMDSRICTTEMIDNLVKEMVGEHK